MEYSALLRFMRRKIREVHVPDRGALELELESASTKTLKVQGDTSYQYALCGRKPGISYVNCCSTHQVFTTNAGGFAVGEIFVDYGLEIASGTYGAYLRHREIYATHTKNICDDVDDV